VYPSSEAQAYRIAKNTKTLYAKIPLLLENKDSAGKMVKTYLSLTGILFDYTTEESMIL
jgi:hypothetical protein